MPVGRVAIRDASLDTVLTTSQDAERFLAHILEAGSAVPQKWVIVHPLASAPPVLPKGFTPALRLSMAHEVHLFPGIPLFIQCPHLSKSAHFQFHLANGFVFDPVTSCVSGTQDDILPLVNYRLPFHIEKRHDTCACGSPLFLFA